MKSLDLEQEVSSFSKSYYDSFSGTAKTVNDSISNATFFCYHFEILHATMKSDSRKTGKLRQPTVVKFEGFGELDWSREEISVVNSISNSNEQL